MTEEIVKKIKLELNESIDFEMLCIRIKYDVLKFMKSLIKESNDIKDLSNNLVKSNCYDKVKEKYRDEKIFNKISFEACFLKITGDVVNQIMFINKL